MPAIVIAPGPGSRIESLDAFRGACALTVFLTHWFLWANFRPAGEMERLLHDSLATIYEVFCLLAWNSNGHHPAVLVEPVGAPRQLRPLHGEAQRVHHAPGLRRHLGPYPVTGEQGDPVRHAGAPAPTVPGTRSR